MRKMTNRVLVFLVAVTLSLNLSASPLDDLRRSFVEASAVSYAPNDEVTERFVKYSDNGRANDVLLLQLYQELMLG